MAKKDDKDLNKIGARLFHGHGFGTDQPHGALYSDVSLDNYSTKVIGADIDILFEGINEFIVDSILKYDVAVGAIAWLTNKKILEALSKNQMTSIIVQKEDFLRMESKSYKIDKWKEYLHKLYSDLKPINSWLIPEAYPGQQEDNENYNSNVQRWVFNQSGEFINAGEAIRCLGYHSENDRFIPRMHHKFLVLGNKNDGLLMEPEIVISGSYNMTFNSTKSRENIIVIRNKKACQAYLSEWAQLWCLSESLDWLASEPPYPTIDMAT